MIDSGILLKECLRQCKMLMRFRISNADPVDVNHQYARWASLFDVIQLYGLVDDYHALCDSDPQYQSIRTRYLETLAIEDPG